MVGDHEGVGQRKSTRSTSGDDFAIRVAENCSPTYLGPSCLDANISAYIPGEMRVILERYEGPIFSRSWND
jgi:hypothetical protein